MPAIGKSLPLRRSASGVPIFANGAVTAAFGYLFNAAMSQEEVSSITKNGTLNEVSKRKGWGYFSSNKHEYHHLQAICVTNCDMAALGVTYNSKGIFPGQTGAIESGAINDALGLPGYNPIQTFLDADGIGGRNVTMEGHIFHKGFVIRDLIQINQTVYSYTYGSGTGNFPGPNEFHSPSFWRGINEKAFH